MGRKYSETTLQALKHGEYETIVKEVPVLVKPIPEGGKDGDMDPRLYKSMRLLPVLGKFIMKPKKNAAIADKIKPLRKMFNTYKGEYVIDQGIVTKETTVKSSDGHAVDIRIYRREQRGNDLPMLIYYHGGGFFGGSMDIVEQMCMLLVEKLDCVVVNVGYRLCPEAHYPQPLDDCWAATCWAYEHAAELGSNGKMAVAGDSAGGNLAAAITLRDREEQRGMVQLQVLIYPAVNIAGNLTEFYHGTDVSLYHKSQHHAKLIDSMFGFLGDASSMLDDVYLQGYLDPQHIYASPLLDDFHDLPPTLLMFGEHDFLAFEDFAYARHANKAGVDLKVIVYRGLGHGFADQIGVMPQAEDLIEEVASTMHVHLQ